MTSGGPDTSRLQVHCETFIKLEDGKEKLFNDWTARKHSNRTLEKSWTGSTTFLESIPQRSSKSSFFSMMCLVTVAILTLPSFRASAFSSFVYYTQKIQENFDGTLNSYSPFSLLTSADNDTYTFKQMLQQDDRA